jgi:signal transduction histidine kinase
MPLGLKTKQVAGVTALVALSVIGVSVWYLAALVRIQLDDTRARAEFIANAIFQRAHDVVQPGLDPYKALRGDTGVLAVLQAAQAYEKDVIYAAIVDPLGTIVVDGNEAEIGQTLPKADGLDAFLRSGPVAQARALLDPDGHTYDYSLPLVDVNDKKLIGTIHVGISTLFIRQTFAQSLQTPLITALLAIAGASLVAMLLAQLVLRPIHVIRSGLARLGSGEVNVAVDLPHEGELGDLGESFKAVSARLAADRTQQATLASVVEHLEDAVALIGADGAIVFANPTMRTVLGEPATEIADLPDDHPYRTIVEDTLRDHEARGPLAVDVPDAGERLVETNVADSADGQPLGVLLVARNLAYLSQVESTLRYSSKLAALGRLSAGIAHEIKNPLNAMMIHLELLRLKLLDHPASEHVAIITTQMRRLDEVVQGFLRFTRPADLRLQPVAVSDVFDNILPIVRAEADKQKVDVKIECPPDLPRMNADAGLLEQACLNLALNACQAMANGGKLRMAGGLRGGKVVITIEDTGVGIPPEQLERIFELYFTTKETGSGIGLSMVYRTVQLHDGDIEVESVPGRGTTFRLILPRAESPRAMNPTQILGLSPTGARQAGS